MAENSNRPKRTLFVESYELFRIAGKRGRVHIRPLPGQWCDATYDVSCSRKMTDTSIYDLHTVFKVTAHLTDREGGGRYAYVNPRDPIIRATKEELDLIISAQKK